VSTLGDRLLRQHPHYHAFQKSSYPEVLAHVKSKEFWPLSPPHHVSHHTTAPSRPRKRR
jgi:hypothetical protein